MAAASVAPTMSDQLSSPFNCPPASLSGGPGGRRHARGHSRNSSATPLPAFTFNPSVGAQRSRSTSPVRPQSRETTLHPAFTKGLTPASLPVFKFNPGAEMEPARSPSPTHPILEEMAEIAQVNKVRRLSRPSALPAFTYNPSTLAGQASPSPTTSEFEEPTHRHKRGGSEFHASEAKPALSSSPHKAERNQGPPVSLGAGRRHAHQRSQAISVSDIDVSGLVKEYATSKHRAESTPSSPVPSGHIFDEPTNESLTSLVSRSPPASPRRRRGSAPGSRPRVGFSDTIDVIPRPLSMISSATEESTSTIRGNHSISGSLSSFVATSPSPRSNSAVAFSLSDGSPLTRPHMADVTSSDPNLLSSLSEGGVDTLHKRPLSASRSPSVTSSSGSPPSKKKHFWSSASADNSPRGSPSQEIADPLSSRLPAFSPASVTTSTRPKTSPERKTSIKGRKVKSWTPSIFSRKSPKRGINKAKIRRTPTPPLTRRANDDDLFGEDNTVVLRNSPSPTRMRKPPMIPTASSEQSSQCTSIKHERMASPIIDLDAALGPFGSEEKLAGDESPAKTGQHRTRRNMYSSQPRGTTDTFGGLVHRRAESAPQMPPISRGLFGIPHAGSSASIADDVFDEEEEDDYIAGQAAESLRPSMQPSSMSDPVPMDGEDLVRSEMSTSMLHQNREARISNPPISSTEADFVTIAEHDFDVDRAAARSSSSTVTAPELSEADVPKRPASAPLELAYPSTQSHYASSNEGRTAPNSAISSPSTDHVSFDNHPRFNRFLSEPRISSRGLASTDDLPSLSDSVSTGPHPRISSSAGTRSSTEQRSSSVCSPQTVRPNQAWKRASLASLNRLIPGSSHGERSKLRTEELAAQAETKKSENKGNRISRLMHFWRSKENGNS